MSPSGVRYIKGHGTQNDFVLLPDLPDGAELTPGLVRALCDRRSGIGADGVLRVAATGDQQAPWFMDHRNADGSPAEMCGNGLRLFAWYLVHSGLADLGEQRIGTRSGVRRAVVAADGAVRVEMGVVELAGESLARLGAAAYPGVVVSVGNPHLVCVTRTPVAELDLSGPPGVDAAVFPDGVNVEFVNLCDEPVPGAAAHVRMRVHERGVGETAACGTGVVAVAATALAGLADRFGAGATAYSGGSGESSRTVGPDRVGSGESSRTVAVDQPGGRVFVDVDRGAAILTGPAVIVGSGVLEPAWLDAVGD